MGLQGVFRVWPLCQPSELCRALLLLHYGSWRVRLWILDRLVLIVVDNKHPWRWSNISWLWEIVFFSFCSNNTWRHVGVRNKKLTHSLHLSPQLWHYWHCFVPQMVDFTLFFAVWHFRQQASYCFGVCSEADKVWLGNVAKLLKGHGFFVRISCNYRASVSFFCRLGNCTCGGWCWEVSGCVASYVPKWSTYSNDTFSILEP